MRSVRYLNRGPAITPYIEAVLPALLLWFPVPSSTTATCLVKLMSGLTCQPVKFVPLLMPFRKYDTAAATSARGCAAACGAASVVVMIKHPAVTTQRVLFI